MPIVSKKVHELAEMLLSIFEGVGERGKKIVTIANKDISMCTSKGMKRENNQDRVGIFRIAPPKSRSEIVIAAIADGMGGTYKGEIAAELTLCYFVSLISIYYDKPLTNNIIQKSAIQTNKLVHDTTKGKGGSTLVASIYKGRNNYIVSAGDSRVYRYNKNILDIITKDDTLDSLKNLKENWDNYKEKDNRLIQHFGQDGNIEPHIYKIPNTSNRDYFLLTSDGAHYVGPEMLQSIINNCKNIYDAPLRIVSVSEWLSGHDNSTALLCPAIIDSEISLKEYSEFIDPNKFLKIKIDTILKNGSIALDIRDEKQYLNGYKNKRNISKNYPNRKKKQLDFDSKKEQYINIFSNEDTNDDTNSK